ncbi:MAG: histidine phosphatase family protein [Acidimicrobiales bacterium]
MSPYPTPYQAKLVVVRHGETEWSESGRHTGRTDVPLLEAGREQARGLAPVLQAMGFGLVLTSPLSRAADTCALAGFAERAEPTDDLLEWDYGAYEGRTTQDIREERPDWSLWGDGVPGGERAAEVGRRVDRVIERARAEEADTLCFAHGHVLRVLASRWVGLPPVGGRFLALDASSLGMLGWEREIPVIERWNEPSPG